MGLLADAEDFDILPQNQLVRNLQLLMVELNLFPFCDLLDVFLIGFAVVLFLLVEPHLLNRYVLLDDRVLQLLNYTHQLEHLLAQTTIFFLRSCVFLEGPELKF
jgi:hypothetical protein